MSARFITFEGAEGTGKSTQLLRVAEALRARGVPVTTTREPGGTSLGEDIRTLLLKPADEPMQAQTELLLMVAARAEHLARVIRPALARGEWVLCDRYADASAAYQGAGRGLGMAQVDALHDLMLPGWRPDRTLLFQAPLEVSRARRAQRGISDRFEAEAEAFHARVRAGYRERLAGEPARIRAIDASGDLPTVTAAVLQALTDWLPAA
jgi:dTMP kinase